MQNVREVAEGKCKTFVLSYNQTAPTSSGMLSSYKKQDGSSFADMDDFNSYVSGLTLANSSFYSQNDMITIQGGYIIVKDTSGLSFVVIRISSSQGPFAKTGDNIIVSETNVPDRWVYYNSPSGAELTVYKLETAKVDLSPYVQKSRTIAGVDLADDVTKAELQEALDMDYSLSSAELEDIFTDPVEEEEEENE